MRRDIGSCIQSVEGLAVFDLIPSRVVVFDGAVFQNQNISFAQFRKKQSLAIYAGVTAQMMMQVQLIDEASEGVAIEHNQIRNIKYVHELDINVYV